jgi:hypothetical protein
MLQLQEGNVKRTYQNKVSEELKLIPANSEMTVEDRWNKIKVASLYWLHKRWDLK